MTKKTPAVLPPTPSLPPLVSLKVENFRSLREVDVVFPDGLIGIVGRNGRGKTSFLRCVTWAFYAMSGVPNKWRKDRLITRDSDTLRVELTFTVAGEQYTVTRTLRRKGLVIESELRRADGVPVTGNDAVSSEIVRLLGPYDKLAISRFVSQKEVNALSVLDPAPRKRLILALLGVEGVEGAIKALRDQTTEFDRTIKARKSVLPEVTTLIADREAVLLRQVDLSRQRTDLVAQMASAKAASAAADTELVRREQIAEAVAASATTMELLDAQLADLAAEDVRISAREAEITAAAARLTEVDSLLADAAAHRVELTEINEAATLVAREPELREQQARLDARIAADRIALARLEQSAAQEPTLSAEEQRLDAEIRTLASAFAAAEGERGERRAELLRINREIDALRAQLAAIGQASVGACPTCGQEIADEAAFRSHLAERERELLEQQTATTKIGVASKRRSEEVSTRQSAAQDRIAIVRTQLETSRAAAGELRLARSTLESYEGQRLENEASLNELTSLSYDAQRHATLVAEDEAVPGLMGVRSDLRAAVAETERLAGDRARVAERRTGYEARRDEAAAAAAAAGYDREATEQAKIEAETAREKVHALDVRAAEIAGEEARATDALAHADQAMAQHGAMTAEIDTILADRAAVDLTRQSMDKFKIELIGRIRPALSRKASELLREMTDGEYSDLVLDEEYGISIGNGPMLWDPGEPSGGEDDLANLCLRLAISELIGESSGAGPSFVVLDEVLGSQDDERRELVMTALPRLSGHFRQVLMVAHVPGVQDRFPVVIPAEWDAISRTSRFIYPPAAVATSPDPAK